MEPVPLLDLKAQYATIKYEIEAAVRRVIEEQMFILGPPVEAFESDLARFTGAKHAIGCASGTDALILSLAALGIGPGKEVVTTPFSFFSTASCAYRVGARPRFVDIDSESFNIDPGRLEDAISDSTAAVLPVHLFGQCADMDRILEVARRRSLPVVEDAAQALSAVYGDSRAGAIGKTGCYSFFPSKNLGGFGDGGAVVTSDTELAERLRILRVHGGRQMYEHRFVGWNSRLDSLQAAVLRVKLAKLDGWSDARAANAARYDSMFRQAGLVDSGDVATPAVMPGCRHIYNQYTLRVRDRDGLRKHLADNGIGQSVYYPVPLHLQECFSELGYGRGDFPESERAAGEVISIPVYPELTAAQQERVVSAISGYYRNG